MGLSTVATDTEVPRSIIRHLELQIAELESELARDGHLSTFNASDILFQMPTRDEEAQNGASAAVNSVGAPSPVSGEDLFLSSLTRCGALQSMISATLPSGSGLTKLLSRVRMGLTPSAARAVISANELHRSSVTTRVVKANAQLDAHVPHSIPPGMVQRLVEKYIQRLLPHHPFLYEGTIRSHHTHVSAMLHSHRSPASTHGIPMWPRVMNSL